jgi:cation transport ATPase
MQSSLTKPELSLLDNIIFLEEWENFHSLLGSVESSSTHPIAKAIVTYCKGKTQIPFQQPANFTSTPGRGIKCDVGDVKMCFGNESYMIQEGIAVARVDDVIFTLKEAGSWLVMVSMIHLH